MRTIKKYPNRRLYDTEASAYLNLDGLAGLVRRGVEVRVVDATTGADLTREVLLQVVLEVLEGSELLPVGMLRRIIRASGTDPASKALRVQLATGLNLVSEQLDRMESLLGPFASPGAAADAAPPPVPEPPPDPDPPAEADAELTALRARLDALESRLKRS